MTTRRTIRTPPTLAISSCPSFCLLREFVIPSATGPSVFGKVRSAGATGTAGVRRSRMTPTCRAGMLSPEAIDQVD